MYVMFVILLVWSANRNGFLKARSDNGCEK